MPEPDLTTSGLLASAEWPRKKNHVTAVAGVDFLRQKENPRPSHMNLRVVRDSSLPLVAGLQKLFSSKCRIPRFLRLLSPNLFTQIKRSTV